MLKTRLLLLLLALLLFAPPALNAVTGGQEARAQVVDPGDDDDDDDDECVLPPALCEPTPEPTEVPTPVVTPDPTAEPKPKPTPKPKPEPKPAPKPESKPAPKPRSTPAPSTKPKATPVPGSPKASPSPTSTPVPVAGVIEPPSPGTPAETEVLGASAACTAGVEGLAAAAVKRQGRGLRFEFARARAAAVDVDVFQTSAGRRVLGERLIVRFAGKTDPFAWDGRKPRRGRLSSGTYFVRYRAVYDTAAGRMVDTRRMTVELSRGRFEVQPALYRLESCETLQTFSLARPVFGGTSRRPLAIAYRLNQPGRVGVTVLRGKRKVVRRYAVRTVPAGRTVQLKLSANGLRKGEYRVQLTVKRGRHTVTSVLAADRL